MRSVEEYIKEILRPWIQTRTARDTSIHLQTSKLLWISLTPFSRSWDQFLSGVSMRIHSACLIMLECSFREATALSSIWWGKEPITHDLYRENDENYIEIQLLVVFFLILSTRTSRWDSSATVNNFFSLFLSNRSSFLSSISFLRKDLLFRFRWRWCQIRFRLWTETWPLLVPRKK